MDPQDTRAIWDPREASHPPEDWEDGEWEYVGIVSEEIDAFLEKSYEIKWNNWHRQDAARTNTTWAKDLSDMVRTQDAWDADRDAEREAKAKASLEITLGRLSSERLWHQDATYERQDAYEEKLDERRRRNLRDYAGWDTIKHIQDDDDSGPDNDLDDDNPPAVQRVRSNALGSRPPRDRTTRPRPPSPSPSVDADAQDLQTRRRLCAQVQAKWSRATREARAAPVYLIPVPGTQQIPPRLEDFEYCEHHYVRDAGVELPDPEFLAGCNCRAGCRSTEGCSCAAEVTNDDGSTTNVLAYNKGGMFKFNVPPGTVVTECNDNCACSTGCGNRVAQRPRDVPLEIFHTGQNGWGVRATIDIQVGKVLGVHTGKLIPYEDVPEEHRSYVFDLDTRDPPAYSVDCYNHGNWSRFINHSCAPNTKVYPVVWDTVPELAQPYLAFVATADIRARTELTIDYTPHPCLPQPAKGKAPPRVPEGARPCRCGAARCRGWLAV